MNISQGSLVIVGANTADAKVYWNGQEVPQIGIKVAAGVVTLIVKEDPTLADMQAAGIIIRRV